ncbi:hypothetical protein [Crateriforma conspicua]|uniref:Ycf48-like protein n=1 Tax=Crateriforma conspicua TaxID=2527996 RepID=A0A5C6FIV6_9PLAN|nr:hypothetical protein [Crateriforma conspicua]TWU61887.1 hypothetical protein V7x_35770 [Crateriforma conspicua]
MKVSRRWCPQAAWASAGSISRSGLVHRTFWAVCFALVLGVAGSVQAQRVCRFPDYSAVDVLREESRLSAVAVSPDGQTCVTVGDRGVILRSADRGQTWALVESSTRARLDDVTVVSPDLWVAVGGFDDPVTGISRGVVLRSTDGGRSWARGIDGDLPRLGQVKFDAARRCLVADGRFSFADLTDRFESYDGGRQWQGAAGTAPEVHRSLPPAAKAPIVDGPADGVARASVTITGRHGDHGSVEQIAVGDHGRIWRRRVPSTAGETADGTIPDDDATAAGAWQAVRGDARRTAILVVTTDRIQTPWRLIASEVLQSGQRTAVLWWDQDSADRASNATERTADLDRFHDAVVQMGGVGLDYQPAAQPSDSADDVSHPEWINTWLRRHRPAVLVIDRRMLRSVRQAWLHAAVKAQVQRVVDYQYGTSGDTLMHAGALYPRLGVVAGDLQNDAWMTLGPDAAISAGTSGELNHLALRWLYDARGSMVPGESIASGLPLSSGYRIAAGLPTASRRDVQIAQARIGLTRKVEALLGLSETGDGDGAPVPSGRQSMQGTLKQQLDALVSQFDSDDRLAVLWRLYRRSTDALERSGPVRPVDPSESQRILLEQIASRFQSQSVGQWAALRSKVLAASQERSMLAATSLPAFLTETSDDRPRHSVEVVRSSPFQTDSVHPNEPQPAEQSIGGIDSPFQVERTRLKGKATLGTLGQFGEAVFPGARAGDVSAPSSKEPGAVDLQWEFHPWRLWLKRPGGCLDTDAHSDTSTESENMDAAIAGAPEPVLGGDSLSPGLQRLAMADRTNGWGELLTRATMVAPVAVTPTRPWLDGRLDDACWREATETRREGVRYRFASDDEFLFVAVVCGEATKIDAGGSAPVQASVSTGSADSAKRRDHDLSQRSHLELRLDVDGDLTTAYQIAMTADRHTFDGVDGMSGWQPTWFYASEADDSGVTFEIAIRRNDLQRDGETTDVWFAQVRWSQPGASHRDRLLPQPTDWVRLRWPVP